MNTDSFRRQYRSGKPHLILIAVVAIFFLQACGVQQTGNWPTISAKDSKVYIAYRQDVISLDVAEKEEAWRFQGESSVEFYAPPEPAPAAGEDTIYLADFGRSAGIFAGGGLIVSMYALQDNPAGAPPTPPTLWISPEDQISGRIVSGMLIEDDTIYTGTSNNQIIAVNRNDGTILWEASTENAVWSPPASLNETIFVSSIDRNIYAINKSDGSIKWTHTLNGAGAGSPVISADQQRVYAGSFGGEVIALNPEDGSDIWKTSTTNADWVWGAPVEIGDELIYADVDGNVYAVDAFTGEEIWNAKVVGSVVGDILVSGDTILVGAGDEESFKGSVTAFSLTGEEIWRTETSANLQSSPVLLNNNSQLAVVYGSAENDIPLGVNVIDVADGSIFWTWTYSEIE
ncbi:MAG: PQQ-binding-like beta-propeller repeat protein [Anaerolineae bacterium]